MKLTAVKSVRYGKVTYAKGETFEVPDRWGRVLRLIGRAKVAEGGDEFGIAKPKKERKEYVPPTVTTRPATPADVKPAAPGTGKATITRRGIATSKKEDEEARAYQTRDMGVQPSSKQAEPLKVEDIEAKEVVKPHEKPAE